MRLLSRLTNQAEASAASGANRQVWVSAVETVEIRTAPPPEPGPGEALVRTVAAGICGSDLHTYRRGHAWRDYPIAVGHEVSGIVERVGPGVEDLAPGAAVLLDAVINCGACVYCTTNRRNLCENAEFLSVQRPGGMADAFVAPSRCLRPVPPGLSMTAAAMIEPLSTVVHAVRAVGGVEGKKVVVLGAGTIGLALAMVARVAGAAHVTVTDLVPGKRALATGLGVDRALDAALGADALRDETPSPADVVFDCVSSTVTLETAIALARRGGTIAVVGAAHGKRFEVPLGVLQDDELRILGVSMSLSEDFDEAERLALGDVALDRLVTATLPLERAADAFELAASGEAVKVQLAPNARADSPG